ncbi:MAG: hypothetical protein R3F35_20130 [Myxococcota bacterium]
MASAGTSNAVGGPPIRGRSAELLFPFAGTGWGRVRPTGRWIVARGHRGESEGVRVQHVGIPKLEIVGRSHAIRRIAWEGPDTLLSETLARNGSRNMAFVTVRLEGSAVEFETEWLPTEGEPQAACCRSEKEYSILARTGRKGELEGVYRYEEDDVEKEVVPVGLARDRNRLLVPARKGGDFMALVELDPETGAIGDEIFRPMKRTGRACSSTS